MSRRASRACAALLMVLGASAAAPAAGAIAVDPTVIELSLPPGGRHEGAFQVLNDGDAPLRVRVEVEPLSAAYAPCAPAEWLTLAAETVDVPPSGRVDVPFTVQVPNGTSGELAAMVVFIQDAPEAGGLQVRFGTAIYAAVRGTEELALEFGEPYMLSGPPPVLLLPVANHGNVHCRPTGPVRVRSGTETLGEVELAVGMPVAPGSTERFRVPWPGALTPGRPYAVEVAWTCARREDPPAPLHGRFTGTWDGQAWQTTEQP